MKTRRQSLLLSLTLALSVVASTVLSSPDPVGADGAGDPNGVLVIEGGGWGHGRGMGQYGAYGYASEQGWSAAQILDHFYGGTRAGTIPPSAPIDPNRVRVDLSSRIGDPTMVQLGSGSISILDATGSRLGSTQGAVRVAANGGQFVISTAPSCRGPWSDLTTTASSIVKLRPVTNQSGAGGLLQVCGGTSRWYDGEIWSTIGNFAQRTLNVVSVEQYLRGVVPNEVPAGWPSAALQAQAVAARSYVMAGDPRRGVFSDTCDTIYCQVYNGRYTERSGPVASTHPRTDEAIAATAGLIRLTSSGAVARTEFSSSTGGFTAGGDFPAVEDRGDSIAANPNSFWSVRVDESVLERRYGHGELHDVRVVERNGHGPFGGRVVRAQLHFERRTIELSGDSLRYVLGLKSTLFRIVGSSGGDGARTDVPVGDDPVVDAYLRFLDRRPNGAEYREGTEVMGQVGLIGLTTRLSRHEEFAGRLVEDLYRAALGRRSDAFGKRVWVNRLDGSLTYEDVGIHFFGSGEYYRRVGGTDAAFVDSLYRQLLNRPAEPRGLRHWVGRLQSGVPVRSIVASFYESSESRSTRARRLGRMVLDRDLSDGEVAEIAELLTKRSDLDVAAQLGLSR